ncbi:MAG: hypothetical protein JNK72_02200 [Myxococcales bacterium]|nr:hypothetical protein [Myxococcales bacterium]
MPEFAEVHEQVRWLRSKVGAFKIAKHGFTGGHFPQWKDDPAKKQKVASFFDGAELLSISQRGKHIVMALSTGTLTAHLMFSGRMTLLGDDYVSNYKHHRLPPDPKANSFWIESTDGLRLALNDPEYRARASAHPGLTAGQCEDLTSLGPEILVTSLTDAAFQTPWSAAQLITAASASRTAIKVFLLEQERQAGIGNMYACEGLYRAKIAPHRPAKSLSAAELSALYNAIVAVVGEAIASQLDYERVLAIYRKSHDPAGHEVKVDKIGGRDTYWVPAVQRV